MSSVSKADVRSSRDAGGPQHLPRVLVVGQQFDRSSGGGITLSSLFAGWDPRGLAGVVRPPLAPQSGLCSNYFVLGADEESLGAPLKWLRHRGDVFGPSAVPGSSPGDSPRTSRKGVLPRFRSFGYEGLDRSGLLDRVRTTRLSTRLAQWVEAFQPDLVYSQLSDLSLVRLVDALIERFDLPLVLHFMDDWPRVALVHRPLARAARESLRAGVRDLLERASVRLTIGAEMSAAYRQRYGLSFDHFQNCVDPSLWAEASRGVPTHEDFVIGYTGRIGKANKRSLSLALRAVSALRSEGYQTLMSAAINGPAPLRITDAVQSCVHVRPHVEHCDMPAFLASCDALILPLDFDRWSADFAAYSMPTKLPEYLASGVPLVVFAPRGMAVSRYVRANACGLVVSSPDSFELAAAFRVLAVDRNLGRKLGDTAMTIARRDHDEGSVVPRFRRILASAVPRHA
jgi:glycosyltransferase involved in cell wall biosynthesis